MFDESQESGLFPKGFFQSLCELIGARRGFRPAANSGEAFDQIDGGLVFGEGGNSLEISVATALDNEVMDA